MNSKLARGKSMENKASAAVKRIAMEWVASILNGFWSFSRKI
jgi:hypothetical protein